MHRAHRTWSQDHGAFIGLFVFVAFLAAMILPFTLIVTIPLGIGCLIAFIAGYIRARIYASGPEVVFCSRCYNWKYKKAYIPGWRMETDKLVCPYH